MTIKKKPKLFLIVLIVLFSSLTLFFIAFGDNIAITAGKAFYLELTSDSDTTNWVGISITSNGQDLSESQYSFINYQFSIEGVVANLPLSGKNFDDDNHYYGIMDDMELNTNNIEAISVSDLYSNQLFPIEDYPSFYKKGYDNNNDNPLNTFCPNMVCNEVLVPIGGNNYSAFKITLNENGINPRSYYLLKYKSSSGKYIPLFLSEIKTGICHHGTNMCLSEMIFPKSSNNRFLFAISKVPVYDITTYVDGVESTIFPYTARPYLLDVEVRGLYDGLLKEGADVIVAENNGMNNFIPVQLSGLYSTAYSVGKTDQNGLETFLVAPTQTTITNNYKIYAAVLYKGVPGSIENMYVSSYTSFDSSKKRITPTELKDNAISSIIASSQIVENLFKIILNNKAKFVYLTYDVSDNSYSLKTQTGIPTSLKTGAPNILDLTVKNGGTTLSSYSGKIKENDGYLIIDPTTKGVNLNDKTRLQYQTFSSTKNIIITPTSYGPRKSNITIEILDPNDVKVDEITLNIDSTLEINSAEYSSYSSTAMSSFVTMMSQLQESLFSVMS